MPIRRSIIGRSLAGYLLAGCIVSLSTSLAQVEGRKCVCTSKACKKAGKDTCRTRFSCYTELIVTTGQEISESTITRGCTKGATPLLCETKSWVTSSRSVNAMELSSSTRVLVPWPRLKCCNSHNYCNANNNDDNENASTRERKAQMDQTRFAMVRETLMDSLMSTNRDTTLTLQPDRKYEDPTESADRLFRNRIRTLHIAALVLAIAALISVLASCYVVTSSTRFVSKLFSIASFTVCNPHQDDPHPNEPVRHRDKIRFKWVGISGIEQIDIMAKGLKKQRDEPNVTNDFKMQDLTCVYLTKLPDEQTKTTTLASFVLYHMTNGKSYNSNSPLPSSGRASPSSLKGRPACQVPRAPPGPGPGSGSAGPNHDFDSGCFYCN